MPLNIVSLVSVGRHPQSGRSRRAEQDGRAVEMGLKLAGQQLSVVHVGNPDEPVLRQYAGMGLSSLTVLKQADRFDAVPVLQRYLEQKNIDIVLTGVRSESGESSGMVPYLLAHALGWPVVARVADIVCVEKGEAQVLLALPRGQRRAVRVALPFIASLDLAAPPARQSAFGVGLRAKIETIESIGEVDQIRVDWQEAEAKPRAKRLKTVKAKTAAERFKAATAKPQGDAGKVLINETTQQKAQAIFDLLLEEKVIR
ncbi:electron transfer flavoprotein subunit beta [Marinomonas pollencensis]|uniref:Electron transfer flavoprotein beta subunit n=1 Tax=Marinomonas pollencensis TaxID=491954 RepID=A0A3E0DIF5_9GAMM|nr:electron transfer flavoprotein subunit beta [Marinomonas pollencensis]REG81588.1 electron transfer flavoprotein beta subunit [Marinomonas pollencensis]